MKSKAASGIMLTLLLIGMFTLAFNVQPAKAEPATWTVDDDGPADFSSIQEAINAASPGDTIYVYNGTYYEHVVVNKSVSLIGDEIAKPTINVTGPSPPVINGTYSTVRISANNVTVSGFEMQNPSGDYCIFLNHSSNSIVRENIFVIAAEAIIVEGGSGNNISNNTVGGPSPDDPCVIDGIQLINSSNNVVNGNYLSHRCHNAFILYNSHNNYVAFNYMANHFMLFPVYIRKSNNNSIVDNTILSWAEPYGGHMSFTESNGNILYHNSFLSFWGDNTISIDDASTSNIWDNGYPSGGNYWSNYTGVDLFSGPHQNMSGSDGIGDIENVIDADNIDHYPLMKPYGGPPGIGITSVTTSKTFIAAGYSLGVNITIMNYGVDTETFNVTAYANTTTIDTLTNITLASGNSTTVTFTWNTTGFAYGTLVRIGANVTQIPRETYLDDNTCVDGWVLVSIVGDVNLDGEVNVLDSLSLLIIRTLERTLEEEPSADVNCDGSVNVLDTIRLTVIRTLAA